MSDETRTALHEAITDHLTAAAGQTEWQAAGVPDRGPLEAAARAHLNDVDPGYHDRCSVELAPGYVLELEPHQRIVVPGLLAEYNTLNELVTTGEPTPADWARHKELAHELAAATQARRILEGRPLTTGVANVAATSTPEA